MPQFLSKLVSNPGVRKAVVALVLAVAAAYGVSISAGCSGAQKPRAVSVFECQLGVLESVIPRSAAEDLVMAARAGNNEYVVKQLLALGLTPDDVLAAARQFQACSAEPTDAGVDAAPVPELTRS